MPQSLSFPLAHPRANDSVDWRNTDLQEVLLTPLPEAERSAYSKTFPVPRGEIKKNIYKQTQWDAPCRDTTSLCLKIKKKQIDLHENNLHHKSSRDMSESSLYRCVRVCR